MRTFLMMPLAIFMIFIIIILSKMLGSGNEKEVSALLGKPLPAFDLPIAIDGIPGLKNTDITGGKYSLVNVFASWCITCKIEHPFLMKLQQQGIPIYGIAWKDNSENLKKWLKEKGNPYKQIGADIEGKTIIDLGVTGAPETLVISDKGIILYRYAGTLNDQVWNLKILPVIEGIK